jgi:hypothetical protein
MPSMPCTLLPALTQRFREWLHGLSLEALREIHVAVCRELDRREDREKNQLPDHVQGVI